jgi:hypothetical protein
LKRLSFVIVLILFFLTGCSYTGYLHKGFHEPNKPIANKINLSAALVNTQELQDLRIQEYTGGHTFTFYINPSFNEELVKDLRNVFLDVQIIATSRELEKFNIQVIPTLSYEYIDGSAWNGQYRYRATMALSIQDIKLNTTIDSFKDTQDVIFSPSAGTTFLSFLTGLSLFILSPVTIPLSTQIGGDNAMSTIEESLSRSIKILSYQLVNSPKIYNYR